ncbi:MAG: M48 family metalloprotease [Ignavibacteriales bacterium]|nr:M48 family metalloprotease [Ignavibacteriales bacterium]
MRRIAWLLVIAILSVWAPGISQSVEYTKRSKNEVRDGPGSYFQLLKVLPKGVPVPIMKRDGGWVNFKPGNSAGGMSVWLSKNCLVEGKPIDLLRDLKLEWQSSKASPSAVAAAIRGFAVRYGKVPSAVVDTVLGMQEGLFTSEEYAEFELMTKGGRLITQQKSSSGIADLMKEPESSVSLDGLGAGIAARLASQGLVSNRQLVKYVNLLAATLAVMTPYFDTPMRVYVLKGEEPRAYAIPGGYIFLGEGLIHLCSDEAELAAIIAHEIAHLAAGHAMEEEFQRRFRVRMDEVFAELERELDQKPDSSETDLEEMIQEAYDEVVKPRLQVYEEQADKAAVMMLSSLGYDAQAVPGIVEKTGRVIKGRVKDWTESPFMHLDFEKRYAALHKLLQANPGYAGGARNGERFRRIVR